LRVCSVSYFDAPVPRLAGRASVVSEGWEGVFFVCLEVREGNAKRSSVSDESDRPGRRGSGVDIVHREKLGQNDD
jgi:hypothetical protein